MRDMQEIKALLQKNNEILLKLVEILGDGAEPIEEPIEEPTPEPKQTRDELEKVVRKGLYAFQNRGGDPRALTFAILGNKLKTLEMDEDQLLAVLNHKEVQ